MGHCAHLGEVAIRASFALPAATTRFRGALLAAARAATALLFVYINDDYIGTTMRYRGHDEIHEGVACIEALLATRHPQLNFIPLVDFVPHPPSAFGRIIHHYVNWTSAGRAACTTRLIRRRCARRGLLLSHRALGPPVPRAGHL